MIATLAATGSFKPKKIQKGMASTRISVVTVILGTMMWKYGWTQVAVALATGSQFAEMGAHWNTATRKMAMACKPLNVNSP
jgi:hypothetical protein